MSPPIRRREAMALGAAGLTALAGCQTGLGAGSRTPARIVVSNLLDDRREIWVQLTRTDDSDPIGESFMVEPNSSLVLERDVPIDTYELTGSVDDPSQGPKDRIEWQIRSDACTATGVISVVDGSQGPDLSVHTASCEES